jgi:hypothetical protein
MIRLGTIGSVSGFVWPKAVPLHHFRSAWCERGNWGFRFAAPGGTLGGGPRKDPRGAEPAAGLERLEKVDVKVEVKKK